MLAQVKLPKQAGMIALIGAVIGVGISLLLNAAYSLTPDGVDLPVPPWQPALEQIAGPILTFGPAVEIYHLYGRLVFLVVAAFTAGLYGLYAHQRIALAGQPPRLLLWGYRLAMAGLVLNLFGNIGDYWVSIGETIDFVAFAGGTMVGLLLQAIGLVLLAISGLRRASISRPVAWALLLWFPFSFVLLMVGMENLPAAPLLALSLAWVITGASMAGSAQAARELPEQTI